MILGSSGSLRLPSRTELYTNIRDTTNNMPHRVVLHVSNETESCEICGAPGSERLLAHGDLLFYDGTDSNPRHIQGFGVLDKEREAVIERLKLKLPEVRVNDA